MKALVIAAAFAALSANAPAGAAREAHSQVNAGTPAATVMADASRLGSAGLTALHGGNPWTPATHETATGADFDAAMPQIDNGTLLIALAAVGLVLYRPLGRAMRRQEQQRRAAALASTLGQTPRG